jgi:purine-binding chemotaxis protein CheW
MKKGNTFYGGIKHMTTAVAGNEKLIAAQKEMVNSDQTDTLGGKYLTFKLSDEEYGVQILKVREIIGLMDITKVPQMPSFVKGVVNLRGKVIPVIDLRSKFGLPQVEYTEQTCIIVIDVGGMVGTIVDAVQEVADITSTDIEPAPPMGSDVDCEFILGMAKSKENVKILLDIDKILDFQQWQRIIHRAQDESQDSQA